MVVVVMLFVLCCAAGVAAAVAQAAGTHPARRHRTARHRTVRHRRLAVRTSRSGGAPLVFGIYPGGAAGTVGPSGSTRAEDASKRLAALQQLRPAGHPFVLHLYAGYTGPGGWSADDQVGKEIAAYTAAGFQVELALTYRPSDGGSPAQVSGFADFVRQTVRDFGGNPRFVSLQVTNEANLDGAPAASDGWYKGAKDALINGVIAAKDEASSTAATQIRVGFNWAYATDSSQSAFWSYLGHHGGSRFIAALDWVGFDAYPGTWGPAVAANDLSGGTRNVMINALQRLRSDYLPSAGIPASVPLHVSENGYPTGPGRTDAMQVSVMRSSITTLDAARSQYNISDYRWFDLRDADSSSSSFESQYGLMRDDYTPKPAFGVYRSLVASLSGSEQTSTTKGVRKVLHRRRHRRRRHHR